MRRLTDTMFSTDAMRDLLSPAATVQSMLNVEAALARAEASCGVIPAEAVAAIVAACKLESINLDALALAAVDAGVVAIPLVKQLTAAVARVDPEAAKYVHWGATSQDIVDSALVLQLRDALGRIETDLLATGDALAAQIAAHRSVVMIGRTWMQHALPITVGVKLAGWLDALTRHRERLAEVRRRVAVLQFGGAAGTLASLGKRGLAVANALASDLGLTVPSLPWHAHRDRVAEVATTLGLLVGTLGKIARDVALMMQTEVGEASEAAGSEDSARGGSSAMPHKRNPVACAAILAAATRMPGLVATMLAAMVQEHERALGGWQAEWETLPDIVRLASGALARTREVVAGMTIDSERMRANLDLTHGLVMAEAVTLALGERMGRLAAHGRVAAACRRAVEEGRPLRSVLGEDAEIKSLLPAAELDRLFDAGGYLGMADEFVDRALAGWQTRSTLNA